MNTPDNASIYRSGKFSQGQDLHNGCRAKLSSELRVANGGLMSRVALSTYDSYCAVR